MRRLSLSSLPLLALLACAVLTLSPLTHVSLTPGASFHDNQRILQMGVLALAACTVVWRQLRGDSMVMPGLGVVLALAGFFALGLVSSLSAYSPRHALYEWSTFWLLLVLAALVASEIARPGARAGVRIDRILLGCGVACVVYIGQALFFYVVALISHIQPDPQALTPGFDNFRFLNHVQTVSLPLLGMLALRTPSAAYRGMWWRMTALWWMLLFVTGGRGTLVGVVAGMVAVGCFARPQARAWCRLMVLTALVGFVAYQVLYVAVPWCFGMKPFGYFQELAQRSLSDPSSGRLDLWKNALGMIVEHPWLGAGPLHYAHLARDAHTNAHPHDWPLQIAAEWGLPALACLCAAVGLALRGLWRCGAHAPTDDAGEGLLRAGWWAAGAAILVDGLVSGLIVMPTSQLWIALYLGCAWGWVASRGQTQTRTAMAAGGRRWAGAVVAWVSVLAIGAVLYAAFPEVLDIPAHEADYRPPKRAFFAPRMWRNGYF